jgi:hypothetical protein
MVKPRLSPEQIAQVSGLVAQCIARQRERYASRAVPLSKQQRVAMDGFLSPHLLDGRRLLMPQSERVPPRFLPDAEELGLQQSGQSAMTAITFVMSRSCGSRSRMTCCITRSSKWKGKPDR